MFNYHSAAGRAYRLLITGAAAGNLHALRIHPEGRYVFVGRGGTNDQAGIYVVDSEASPAAAIVKHIPADPHNFAISPDGNYLVAGESSGRIRFIDISSLKGVNPVPADVAEAYVLEHAGFGGNH